MPTPEELAGYAGNPHPKAKTKLPMAWGVLYAAPNPDGSRKKCENCFMWSLDNQCAIHDTSLEIVAEHTCGYHVYGVPGDERMDHPGLMPVDPKMSGLELVVGGTSCDICKHYIDDDAQDATACAAVATPAVTPQPVDPLGCCARWEKP